jgi:hypothetical protein
MLLFGVYSVLLDTGVDHFPNNILMFWWKKRHKMKHIVFMDKYCVDKD